MSEICMNAHKIKVALESKKATTYIWYVNNYQMKYVTMSYSDLLNEYSISYSGITIWFDKFVYEYKNDRLFLYSKGHMISIVHGDFK